MKTKFSACTQVHVRSLLLFICFFTASVYTSFGQSECGTADPTDQEIQEVLAEIENARSSFPRGGAFDIPIHLTIINDDNGTPPIPYGEEQIFEAIEAANEFFTNGMQFFLCEVSQIDDSDYFNTALSGPNMAFIAGNNNQPEVINLYLVKEISSAVAAASPINESIAGIFTTTTNPVTLAHELGHFFGLQHTYLQTTSLKILPDNTYNPLFSALSCFCCDCSITTGLPCVTCVDDCVCVCGNSGDYVCDTPPDPGSAHCGVDCNETNCVAELTNGGQTYQYTYAPDKQNIMSDYGSCRESFSEGQLNRMRDFLFTFGDYLIDLTVPSCSTFDFAYTTEYGVVERISSYGVSGHEFDPLENARVRIFDYATSASDNATTDSEGQYGLFDGDGNADIYIQEDRDVKVGQHVAGNASAFNILSGISTQDLILIRKHILNTEQLPKPYAWIAADVNNSGTITTLDVIKLARLIIGTEELDVPVFRYFPLYALDGQWDFEDDFNLNPFTSVWNLPDSEVRPYLASGGNKSYLDDIDLNLENPDVAETETWSFRAIKSGDVNFSFDPAMQLQEPDYEFEVEAHDCLAMSETATVLVKMDGTATVGGFQFDMDFNPAYFEILGIDQGEITPFNRDFFALDDLQNGRLSTLWIDPAGGNISLSGEKTLFKVYIKAASALCNIEDHFELVNNSFATEVYSSTGAVIPMDITVEVIPDVKKHFLTNVFPNPGTNVMTFDFELTEAANVSITVQDQYSNTLNYSNSYTAGTKTYTFTNISSLNAGALYYSINMGGEISTGTVIKL